MWFITIVLVKIALCQDSQDDFWVDTNSTKDYDDFDGSPVLKISFHERATTRLT